MSKSRSPNTPYVYVDQNPPIPDRTYNRRMSGVSLTSELAAVDAAFGLGLAEMEWLTTNAMKSAFAPFPERLRIINGLIKPRYALLRADQVLGA